MGNDFKEHDYGDIVFHTSSTFPSEKIRAVFDDACALSFNGSLIANLLDAVAPEFKQLRRDELLYLFRSLHGHILTSVFLSFKKHNIGKFRETLSLGPTAAKALLKLSNLLSIASKSAPEPILQILKQGSNTFYEEMSYHRSLTPHAGETVGNEYLAFTFPERYVTDVGRLIYYDWFAACFCERYDNPSIWAHYGDSHRGACLIFNSGLTKEEKPSLTLQEGGRDVNFPFYKINYIDRYESIDFFRSLGRDNRSILMSDWYTDDTGSESRCADIFHNLATWRDELWRKFYSNITSKLDEWSYEAEHRLVISDMLYSYKEKKTRTLRYNFSSLEGIIFGINTSPSYKLQLVEVIREKCKKEERSHFDFFQAYYSPSSGRIDLRRLNLLKSPFP